MAATASCAVLCWVVCPVGRHGQFCPPDLFYRLCCSLSCSSRLEPSLPWAVWELCCTTPRPTRQKDENAVQLLLQVTCETCPIDQGLQISQFVVPQGLSRVSSPLCLRGGNLGGQCSSPSKAVTSNVCKSKPHVLGSLSGSTQVWVHTHVCMGASSDPGCFSEGFPFQEAKAFTAIAFLNWRVP